MMASSLRCFTRLSFATPIRTFPLARIELFLARTHHPFIQSCGVRQKAGPKQKQRKRPSNSSTNANTNNNKDSGSTGQGLSWLALFLFMATIPARRRRREEREKETSGDLNGGVDLEET